VRGRREIDASGLVVAPGFVDLHSHADLIVLGPRPVQESLLGAKIAQGVTSIVVGNCGLGVAPATPEAARTLAGINGWMTPDGVAPGALSVGEYLDGLEQSGVALNVATLVPHGPLRISAMGLAGGEPTPAQLDEMRGRLAEALDAGALGLSTGLIYPPGMYATTDELVDLARVVAGRDALFTSHVRGSSETLLDATRELIEVARESGAAVHHSHLEAVGERHWPDVAAVLRLEDEARASGVRVSHDVFPYTRAATMMSAVFPPWALEGGVDELLRRLEEPRARERLRREIATSVPEWPPWTEGGWPHNLVGAVGWDGIVIASVGPAGPADLTGRSLADVAAERGADPFDVVADLMLAERGRVGQLVDEISGRGDRIDALLAILAHPAAAVISDAEDYGRGVPHPAHAGAFARALRLNRERGLVPLEEMVRRMTGYPAAIARLADRGVLREGAFADVVVFDAGRVADLADWDDPRRKASGVEWVIVNGRVVVERGEYRGGFAGRVLRAAR
jgi:N-acyl-D-aspartate/D-glutamate deacylase